MLRPLKRSTIVDAIIKMILEMIDNEALQPGSRLPSERIVAEQLGVSRTSVRGALQSLFQSGIITIKPGSGTYLSHNKDAIRSVREKYNPAQVKKSIDYLKVCEYRMLFDSKIAALAAKNATLSNMEALSDSYKRMKDFLDAKEINQYHIEDLQFHILIAQATHNDIISKSYSSAINYLADITPSENYLNRTFEDHKLLLDAICEGKQKLAEQTASNHASAIEENLFSSSSHYILDDKSIHKKTI